MCSGVLILWRDPDVSTVAVSTRHVWGSGWNPKVDSCQSTSSGVSPFFVTSNVFPLVFFFEPSTPNCDFPAAEKRKADTCGFLSACVRRGEHRDLRQVLEAHGADEDHLGDGDRHHRWRGHSLDICVKIFWRLPFLGPPTRCPFSPFFG